jgi:hypothetical protein
MKEASKPTGSEMPGSWNSETYRVRAKEWRDNAEALPPGKEREACVVLANGYASLSAQIEASGLDSAKRKL